MVILSYRNNDNNSDQTLISQEDDDNKKNNYNDDDSNCKINKNNMNNNVINNNSNVINNINVINNNNKNGKKQKKKKSLLYLLRTIFIFAFICLIIKPLISLAGFYATVLKNTNDHLDNNNNDYLNHYHQMTLLQQQQQQQQQQQRLFDQIQPVSIDYHYCNDCTNSLIRLEKNHQTKRCGDFINQYITKQSLTLIDAINKLKQLYPKECEACSVTCNDNENNNLAITSSTTTTNTTTNTTTSSSKHKPYWRVDDIAPTIYSSYSPYLSSIPNKYRIPTNVINDLSTFFSNQQNVYPNRQYFFEYNPSIIQIPTNQIPNLDYDYDDNNTNNNNRPVYLISFRVSSYHECINSEYLKYKMFNNTKRHVYEKQLKANEYIGFALLRNDFSIIIDTIVDFQKISSKQQIQDPKLVVLNNKDIFLTSSKDNNIIVPIWLVIDDEPSSSSSSTTITTTTTNTNHNNNNDIMKPYPVREVFPTTKTTTTTTTTTTTYKTKKTNNNMNKKNNQKFIIYSRKNRMSQPLKSSNDDQLVLKQDITKPWYNNNITNSNNNMRKHLPLPSFSTIDELYFIRKGISSDFPYTQEEHGSSSCCVPIIRRIIDNNNNNNNGQVQDQQQLLLGISHIKTPVTKQAAKKKIITNQFFSTFYVMDAKEPYKVIARTGKFCFGFHNNNNNNTLLLTNNENENENQKTIMNNNNNNPYTVMNTNSLSIDNIKYNCPRIHFVSSMIEKADDTSKLIITYSINDCTSRIIEISKNDVLELLFPPTTVDDATNNIELLLKIKKTSNDNNNNNNSTRYENNNLPSSSSNNEKTIIENNLVVNTTKYVKPKSEIVIKLEKREDITIDYFCDECSNSLFKKINDGNNNNTVTTLKRCGDEIYNFIQKYNITKRSAAHKVYKLYPKECHKCKICPSHISTTKKIQKLTKCFCNNNPQYKKVYYRFDEIAPKIYSSYSHYLPSIPNEYRLPTNVINDLSSFFSSNNQQNVYPNRTYLFEYNPSIIQIPTNQIPNITTTTTNGNNSSSTNNDNDDDHHYHSTPVYLASYRVSPYHECIRNENQFQMLGNRTRNMVSKELEDMQYVGFALLRNDFTIISDTIIQFPPQFKTDPRLFVLNNGKDIYITSNDIIYPIWLVPQKQQQHSSRNMFTKSFPLPNPFSTKTKTNTNTNTNNELIIYSRHSHLHSCSPFHRPPFANKNLGYFYDKELNISFAEEYPMGYKLPVTLDDKCQPFKSKDDLLLLKQDITKPWYNNITNSNDMRKRLPLPSFSTIDELYFIRNRMFPLPYTNERGSACCVPIIRRIINDDNNDNYNYKNNGQHVKEQKLLLGISHIKTPVTNRVKGMVITNQFFSTFYVMEAKAPYKVIARTGKFCFGFHTNTNNNNNNTTTLFSSNNENENQSLMNNPYIVMNDDPLIIGTQKYNCPKIHFVSSMIEKADDPSKLIIAYGINDCTSRMIEISKNDVLDMLFPTTTTTLEA